MRKSLTKDERGIGHVLLAVLIVVIVAAVGFAGWRVMQNNKTPAAAKTGEGKVVNDACLKVYDDKALCDAAAVSADFGKLSYTAVATSVDPQGQTSKINLESDGKGNTSFTTVASGQDYSTIQIGATVYTKTPGSDSWYKYTGSNAPTTTNPSKDLKAEFSDTSTPADKRIQYKKVGTEKCGDGTCLKYQVINPASPNTTGYVWFNTKTYRMQRVYVKDSSGTNDFVITYAPVKITAPSPVVEAPSLSGQ